MPYNNINKAVHAPERDFSMFMLDSAEDIAKLPTRTDWSKDGLEPPCQMGSIAHVVGGAWYVLISDNTWKLDV